MCIRDRPQREANLLIQGASISGGDFETQMRVGRRLDALSQFADSIRAYSEAIQCMPNDVEANRGLAEALMKTGKRKLAARYFRAAGDEARAAAIEKQFDPPTLETGVPKIPQPQTDEQRAQRLLDILGD